MITRHAPLNPGAIAWLDCHSRNERPDLVNHARVLVLECDRVHQTIRVRIDEGPQKGSEAELLDWQVTRWQYEVNGRWLDEAEPEALNALASELANERQKSVPPSIAKDHLKYIADTERVLARHKWKAQVHSVA